MRKQWEERWARTRDGSRLNFWDAWIVLQSPNYLSYPSHATTAGGASSAKDLIGPIPTYLTPHKEKQQLHAACPKQQAACVARVLMMDPILIKILNYRSWSNNGPVDFVGQWRWMWKCFSVLISIFPRRDENRLGPRIFIFLYTTFDEEREQRTNT